MSRTDLLTDTSDPRPATSPRSAILSGALFDDVIVPLANEHRGHSAPPQSPRWRDPDASTFFLLSSVSRMTAADFEFPGGGTAEGLVDALAAYWLGEGETRLADCVPHLREIVEALRDEVGNDDGSVDIFCYTLF
jgi:hypothetical protein